MPRHWYIKTKRGKKGPVTSKMLLRLAGLGKIKPNAGVSPDGKEWFKAKEVQGLCFPEKKLTRWWVQTHHGNAGPFTIPKLQKLVDSGRIGPKVAISSDGKEWIKAKRLEELEFPSQKESRSKKNQSSESSKSAVGDAKKDRTRSGSRQKQESDSKRKSKATEDPPTPSKSRSSKKRPSADSTSNGDENIESGGTEIESQPLIVERFDRQLPLVDEVVADQPSEQQRESDSDADDSLFESETEPVAFVEQHDVRHRYYTTIIKRKRTSASPPDTSIVNDVEAQKSAPKAVCVDNSKPKLPATKSARDAAPTPLAVSRWADSRAAQYTASFGPSSQIDFDDIGHEPRIDVFVHPPNQVRPITTLVTSGMSDHAMPIPDGPQSSRVELILYVEKMHPGYIEILRRLAKMPLRRNRVFSYGSVVENGHPARPIFGRGSLDHFLLMVPNVESDFALRNLFSIENAPLQLLWVVPITTTERNLIDRQGMKTFCELVDRNQHPLTIDPKRHCYVSSSDSIAPANEPIRPSHHLV